MIKLKIIEGQELKEWDKIVKESPYGTIFHTLEWMEILERTYNVKKLPIGIYQDDKMIGVFPAFLQRKGIFKLITSPLREAATPYGGPLIKENFLKEVTLAFDKFTKSIGYIDVTFSPKMDLDHEILRSSNYEKRFTYILNLDRNIDDIWKNLNKKCRNMIRKAEKSNVKIIEGDKKEYLEDYYKMVEDTYKKSNTKPPISMKYYKTLFEVLYPDRLKILFAEYNGRLIAGAIFPYFDNRIYYWDGASYQEYNKVAPNNLIQWHLIKWAVENGFKVYDMIGANIPSIAKFKASFGGDMMGYFYVYKFNSMLAKYGRKAYVWWRKNIKGFEVKMKVCMVTTVHPAFDDRIYHKEAKSLAKVHEVVLVAPDEERTDKEVDGVRIITIKKPKSNVFHPITMWRVFKAGFKQDCDVYHCHEPSSLFVSAVLKILKRKKLIYDAHEHYPSLIAENSLFPPFIRLLVRFLADIEERVLIRFADVVITVDEILASKYRKHHNNVHIISNYPKLELFKPDDLNSENGGIIYVGGISRERGIYQMINAANRANVKLICVGNFTDKLNENEITNFLDENPSKNVVFTGLLSHSRVVEYINMSKLGLSLLQPIPRYEKAVPIKLFEYMACEIPVIASNFPEISKVVKEADCGILVDPTDINKIADAITYLLGHPEEAKRRGRNGRRAVEENYNWDKMEEKLLKLYEGLK